nr:ChaN family lipoprotein [uncultured Carboxylicivirga sp.]
MKHLTLIVLCSCFVALSQAQDTIVDYLQKVQVDYRTQEHIFSDSVLTNYDIVLFGESHGFKDTHEVKSKALQEYAERTDFSWILGECDLLYSRMMNEYILNEDTLGIKKVLDTSKGTFNWTRQHYEFYKQIIDLNKNRKNKIKFLGIDIPVSGSDSTASRIIGIMQKYGEADAIMDSLLYVFNANDEQANHVKQLLDNAGNKTYDAEDLFEYNYLLKNILYLHEANKGDDLFDQVRDSCMFLNYQMLVKHLSLEDEKMIGFFGSFHVFHEESNNIRNFGSWLCNMADKKIYSYNMFYFKSRCIFPEYFIPPFLKIFRSKKKLYYKMTLFNDNRTLALGYKPGMDNLKKVAPRKSITMYDLTAKESPYKSKSLLVFNGMENYHTTDYFQTAIVIKNSKPAEPLGRNRQ